jgi:predicted lysophospholipase L1 biosynthesis ABC-type transport system permease subunit
MGWAGLITGTEWLARRALRSRSQAWLFAYGALGGLVWLSGARLRARTARFSVAGVTLATIGYPLGRRVLGDRPSASPAEGFALELVALDVVAFTEELTWGAIVEPVLGPAVTATLFASKHVLIDGRWRRGPGLFAFWMGLAAQRRRWPAAALVLHGLLNAAGVVQGHVSGRDRF